MDGSRSHESTEPVEVYEHVPWAQLAVPPPTRKPWVVYLAAGAIAAAALGALVVRSVGHVPDAPVAAAPLPVAAPVTTTLPLLPEKELLTEADLLAVTPGRGELTAAARAEWFVTDYFSSGGEPGTQDRVLDALPDDAAVPADTLSSFSSYVEWVTTSRIEAIGDQRFRSTVLFRMLASSDDEETYVRLPVQAVDVVVEVDASGASTVVDLPMPVDIPTGPPVPAWTEPIAEVPDQLRGTAVRLAEAWGIDPSVIHGSRQGNGWRVVVEVADEAGIRWPLTVWLTDQGEPTWREAATTDED